jgi:hypothetical protein
MRIRVHCLFSSSKVGGPFEGRVVAAAENMRTNGRELLLIGNRSNPDSVGVNVPCLTPVPSSWLGTEIKRANLSRMHFVSGCKFGVLLINLCKELLYIGNQ